MKKIILFLICIVCNLSSENVVQRLANLEEFSTDHDSNLEKIKKLSQTFEKKHPFKKSDVPLDLFIPTVERDLVMLPHTIEFARKNLLHPIRNIYVVAPALNSIIECARSLGCVFVDETTVLPIRISDIDYFPSGCERCDRRGWLYQQLLKLNLDTVCECEHVLVIDTDTLLVRPQAYVYKGRTIFHCSNEMHRPYRESYKRLMKEEVKGPLSFVSHTTLFEKSKLREMKDHIEKLHGKPWYQAIMDAMDKNEMAGFAENETYPQFVISRYPDAFIQLYFFNRSLSRSKYLRSFLKGKVKLDPLTKSVSFHHWKS